MALQRPNAVVFQEFETLVSATETPDLDALIVGPCYQIIDYLDDKTNAEEDTAYGELNGTIPTLPASLTYVDPVAVAFSSPKNIAVGGVLDSSSVKLFFDSVRAVVATADASGGGTNDKGQYNNGDNWFSGDVSGGGVNFDTAGVAAGDILLVQSPTTDDYVKTVKEISYTFIENSTSKLDLVNNNVAVGDVVTITLDTFTTSRNGVYTVKRVIDAKTMEVDESIPGYVMTGAETATVRITSPSGALKVEDSAVSLDCWAYLRCTTDFAEDASGNLMWRIERTLTDVEMDSADITISGNAITVKASLTTDISATLTDKPITYAKIYFEYMALRTDLAVLTDITSSTQRTSVLGKLDARNPLAVGAYVAALNAPTMPIRVYGIDDVTNEAAAYLTFIDRISTIRRIYTITPLTYNTTVLAALNSMAENLADPNFVLSNGIRQKFRMILGAVDLPTQQTMQAITGGATTEQENNTDQPTVENTGTFAGGVGGTATLVTSDVLPGDIIAIDGTPTYTISHVNSETAFEVDSSTGPVVPFSSTGSEVITIYTQVASPKITLTSAGAADITITESGMDKLYTILYLPGATFLTNGVIPTDEIEIPSDPNTNTWTTYSTWVVDEVVSEERLRVVNNGSDTSTAANELPHTGKRIGGALVTQGDVWVRVVRDLSKTQQVTNMVATATSFSSKRVVLAYPNSVDVNGLVDGSKTRTGTTAEAADPQPGYYLACAIAGQTASQPSQQGFTNMGIAGIDRVYNASEYFNEQQMTDLSNGGVYVFQQDTETSLPYTIHEVTTDTTALQTGEYMYVKNVDYVSWTMLDTILTFIGEWNVTPQAVEFIEEALENDIENLKARYVAKIGAPLIDATITGTEISDLSSDRIETYIDGDFPMTLNTIGLHLVA